MKNSMAPPRTRSKSSSSSSSSSTTILPPLRSATSTGQASPVDERKDEWNDEKITAAGTLSRMVDELHIDESTTRDNATSNEGWLSKRIAGRKERDAHNFESMPSYDIDQMTTEELRASLCRITENVQQPFSFLAGISKEFARDDNSWMTTNKPTDIDEQLSTVTKRIESCKMLLERAKCCVEETRDRAKPMEDFGPSWNG